MSVDQELMDESAVGADEAIGCGFLPLRLHAGWTSGFQAQTPTVKLLPRALEAAQMMSVDLDMGGFGVQKFHGDLPIVADDE
jgi:hypothetical protein